MNGKYLSQMLPELVAMTALLEERAARDPSGLFYTWAEESETVGEFNRRVNRVARNLQRLGVAEGTHVAVLMATSPDYLAVWFALAKLGAVELPLNSAYHGEILRHQLVAGEASVVVADAEYAARIEELVPVPASIDRLIVRGEHARSSVLGWTSFDELIISVDESNLGIEGSPDRITGIIFTSGTTGPSKGVLLSQHYLAAYGLMYAEINQLREDDALFVFLPFFHVGAKFMTIAALAVNARIHLAPRLSVSMFWADCRRFGITNFVAVGGICNMLLSRPPRADDKDTSIRTVYAVPDPADIHEEFEARFGCHMTTVYGSTETGLPIFRAAGSEYMPGSCGRVSPYYEVAIFDPNDQPLPRGEVGEIVVRPKRSYLVGSGYIGMPDQTVGAWRNLWLHTGDMGRIDSSGWCWFEDRASDSMRRRGENISSYEVELLAAKHPGVAEAAAVAARSEVGEDDVWLLIRLRDGYLSDPDELFEHCRVTMPYFMVPRYIEIVDEFPRTPTAKIEKYRLRSVGPGPTAWDRERHGWVIRRGRLTKDVVGAGAASCGGAA